MKAMDFRGRWVLVTGASSGLGQEMARILAHKHGANLIVAARRKQRLEALKQELEKDAGVRVVTISADLARTEDVERMFAEATKDRDVYGVILNAGITHFGEYHELAWDELRRMVDINVVSVARAATLFLPYLEKQAQSGGLMMVSSMAGLSPVPYQAAYSGTKAFLINYGASLHHEVHGRGVSVTVFVPGGIQTEMTAGERFEPLKGWLMPVDQAAREGIEALRKRRYIDAPGAFNKLSVVAARLLPQRFLHSRVGATYRAALDKTR